MTCLFTHWLLTTTPLIAVKVAMDEVHELGEKVDLAKANLDRINAIPKGKAGRGKRACSEIGLFLITDNVTEAINGASNQLRDARKTQKLKIVQLEEAQRSLDEAVGHRDRAQDSEEGNVE